MDIFALHVFDLDDTLYRSPRPVVPDSAWWFHAHSFGEVGLPGYDPRWILLTVVCARRAILDPLTKAVLLTGRPNHPQMKAQIEGMLRRAGLQFDAVQLQPVLHTGSTAAYKAAAVQKWLDRLPKVKKVVLYDDQADNHAAVQRVVQDRGVSFQSCSPTPL